MILGAGLSGLSLACALLEQRVEDQIVLIDRRTTWDRDRTWCTWSTEETRFAELAGHRWPAWRIVADGREAVARSARHPYLHLKADDVYRHALARLASAPNVELRSGETVSAVSDGSPRPTVRTSAGEVEASVVFDALGSGSPLLRDQPAGRVELAQRFLGWEVEVDAPVFDRDVATLMDFRPDDQGGLRFFYVLPFSSTRALIEDTSIGSRGLAPDVRRRSIEAELTERWGCREWQVLYEERGHVPMNTREFALHHGAHIHAIGSAAGAIRASSGYAFTRIQRHCDRVARALAHDEPLPRRLAPWRLRSLDAIFLRALESEPDRFPEIFRQMAAGLSGDTFARFMTDSSSPVDEARIVAALPKRPFLRAARRGVANRT